MAEIEKRLSRRDLLRGAAMGAAGLGLSFAFDRLITPTASAQTLLNQAVTGPSSVEQHENIVLPKFRCVMAWGQYPGERKTKIAFDTQGAKVSGTANTWDGKNPVSFTNRERMDELVDWTDVDAQLGGEYNTHLVSYWNSRVAKESGLTFYFEINPEAPTEEHYKVQMLNTYNSGDRRIYWQSRFIDNDPRFSHEFKGSSADVEIRTTDKDGRWNTIGGLFLGQDKVVAEAFKAKHSQYSQLSARTTF